MEIKYQPQIEYPFEVRIPTNGGNASLTRGRYNDPLKLIEGYRCQLELYSGNGSATPYPVEIFEGGRIRQMGEIVLGIKMGLSTRKILKNVEFKLWIQSLESRFKN